MACATTWAVADGQVGGLTSLRATKSKRKLQNKKQANGPTYSGTSCLDDQFTSILEANNIPGGSLAIMLRNEDDGGSGAVVYQQGYGTRDAPGIDHSTENRPFLSSTPSRIFSVSKTVTAMTVAQLAKQGLLNLDAFVFAEGGALRFYIENYSGFPDPRLSSITVRQLLSHTAGFTPRLDATDPMSFPVLAYNTIASELGLDSGTVVTCPDIIQYMVGVPLYADPGTTPAYSNVGYCTLESLVETVTGMSFQQAATKWVWEPLNIDTDQFYIPASSRLEDAKPEEAEYYDEGCFGPSLYNGPDVPCPYGAIFQTESSAGYAGWVASVQEVIKLGRAFDCNGDDDCIINETWKTEIETIPSAWPADTPYWTSHGFFVTYASSDDKITETIGEGSDTTEASDKQVVEQQEKEKPPLIVFHEGSASGAFAWLIHHPKYNIAAVFNGNNNTGMADEVTGKLKLVEMMECMDDGGWPTVEDDDGKSSSSSAAADPISKLAHQLLLFAGSIVVPFLFL